MKNSLTALIPAVLIALLSANLHAQEAFWCGGDLTKLIGPEAEEELQAALEQTCGAIMGALFTSGSTGAGEPATGVLVYDPEEVWAGYTLLSSLGGHLDPDTGQTCLRRVRQARGATHRVRLRFHPVPARQQREHQHR